MSQHNHHNHDHHERTENDKKDSYHMQLCEKTTNKLFEVSVPVTVKPFAVPQKPEINCLGEAEVCPGHRQCEGSRYFEFTVIQKINVDIPIKFGADVCYGRTCATMEEV